MALKSCLLVVVLFCVLSINVCELSEAGVELDQFNLQVGQATIKNPRDITTEREGTKTGVTFVMEAMTANQNLLQIPREKLLEALPYFDQARNLHSNITTELNFLLLSSLLAENEKQKKAVIATFNSLRAKYHTQEYEKALLSYYQGYMHELLLEDIDNARIFWEEARKSPYYELQENFWDQNEIPNNYPREYTMQPAAYSRFLLPLVVYTWFKEQYEGDLSPGDIPVFESDENRLKEQKARGAEVNNGIDIGMGRKNIQEAAEFLQKNEFLFMKHFYSMEEVNLLTEFYQGNVKNKTWHHSYDAYLMRTSVYNDRLGFYLNKQKEKIINQLTGSRKMKMAYAFLCHYEDLGGRETAYNGRPNLRAHTDRKDNELTISITLGNSPLWPLFVHKTPVPNPGSYWREMPPVDDTVEVPVRTGDALAFFGRKHTHWRDPMPKDVQKYSSILHHFVDWSFDYIHYKTYGENGSY
eukprot:TRINITY_DN4166_c0_g1_i1.p1 TRINITY_DN4166_c0_g1~~TRINITY_DN4166_c0_g1_i1.p1  ORF type:complete len:470 (-),score=91.03 TRINITY_DN4166_c0_g1_i1:116-1525(-)